MKKISATLALVLCFAGVTLAQDELSFERKQAIDSLALEKVRDLSKYIKIVGSKETPSARPTASLTAPRNFS